MNKILFAVLFALFLFGCSDSSDNHPLLKKAAQSKRAGEYRNAELCYKRYLAKDPTAAKVHLDLAQLYDEYLEDHLLAVYHYKEYLRLLNDPNSSDARTVRGFIARSEHRYIAKGKSAKKVFLTDEAEIERLTAAYKKKLADEQKQMEKELELLRKESSAADKVSAKQMPDTAVVVIKEDKKAADEKKSAAESSKDKTHDAEQDRTAPDPELAESNIPDSPIADSPDQISGKTVSVNTVAKSAEKKEEPTKTAETDAPQVNTSVESAVHIEKKTDSKSAAAPTEKTTEKTAQSVKKAPEIIKDFSSLPPMADIAVKKDEEKKAEKKNTETVQEYKVQRGDTFTHLSRKFYGSVRYYKKLMEYNNITNANALRIGKILKVPSLEVLKGEKNEK